MPVYDLLVVVAGACLVAALLPERVYVDFVEWAGSWAAIQDERIAALPGALRAFFIFLALVGLCGWICARHAANEIARQLGLQPRWLALLVQLHLLVVLPATAYWFYYLYDLSTVSAEVWREETKIVPWHRDFDLVMERCRQLIPENESVLVVLSQRGTASYLPFINSRLYPRQVFVEHRRGAATELRQGAEAADQVMARTAGVRWIITYSGPREFDASQFSVERIP